MQDFTNFNQPQPSSADGYYRDPLDAAPAAQEKAEEVKKAPEAEPVKEEPPFLTQDADAIAEATHREEAVTEAEPEVKDEPVAEAEPEIKEEPVADATPEADAEPEVDAKAEADTLSPELEEYLETTKKLLERTRKERNNLIVRIDDEEDKITNKKKEASKNPDGFSLVKYDELNKMHSELYRKKDLINALIGVIRTLE